MAEIYTRKGEKILVDECDLGDVSSVVWHINKNGYACRNVSLPDKKTISMMHREVLGLPSGNGWVVDHINGVKADNRRENLRVCKNDQNLLNSKMHKDNLTGFKGVTLDKRRGTYQAKIQFKKRQRAFGGFATPELAHEFYCLAADMLHGEFANHGDGNGKDR